jgi:hypothetical protein
MQTMSILETLSKTFPDPQARSIVKALEEFEAEKRYVTKDQLDVSLKDLEIRLVKWVIGLMIAQTSITIAVLKMMGN